MITWREMSTGCIVEEPGNAKNYKTGDWRSLKPAYNKDRCIKCGVCYMFCPDAAVKLEEDGYIKINDFYCKGCGICSKECPVGAFKMVPLSEDDKWESDKE